MAGKKLSAKAQQTMAVLEEGRRKARRLHGFIEQYCSAHGGQDSLAQSIARTGSDVARVFMNAGLGVMADTANQIGMGIKRGGHTQSKYRQMRELMGSLLAGIDRQEKVVMDMDAMAKDDPEGSH